MLFVTIIVWFYICECTDGTWLFLEFYDHANKENHIDRSKQNCETDEGPRPQVAISSNHTVNRVYLNTHEWKNEE